MKLYYNPRLDTVGIFEQGMLCIESSIYMALGPEWILL